MTILSFPQSLIGIAFPVERDPNWSTFIQEMINGKTTRIQLYTYPRYKYTVPFSYLGANSYAATQTDWQQLQAFYNQVAGPVVPWHWNDPYDNSVTTQSIGTGDGTTTVFNFVRTLAAGSYSSTEPTQDVTATNLKIYVNGVLQTITTDYTLVTDPNWGFIYAVQFVTAPANGYSITWTGNYQWPCQFDEDSIPFSNFAYGFWESKEVKFTTMKVV